MDYREIEYDLMEYQKQNGAEIDFTELTNLNPLPWQNCADSFRNKIPFLRKKTRTYPIQSIPGKQDGIDISRLLILQNVIEFSTSGRLIFGFRSSAILEQPPRFGRDFECLNGRVFAPLRSLRSLRLRKNTTVQTLKITSQNATAVLELRKISTISLLKMVLRR